MPLFSLFIRNSSCFEALPIKYYIMCEHELASFQASDSKASPWMEDTPDSAFAEELS